MPAILSGKGDEIVGASPTGNKWRQCSGDAESDSETANKSDEVAWEQQRHRGDRSFRC